MLKQDYNRIDPKRRNVLDHRKKQFASPTYKEAEYPHRLNFYADAPTADITLEQFEQWAIDRLRILAELEACAFRNKSPQEVANHMKPLLDKYLPLESNMSHSPKLFSQRQKDHYSHFILRLAFSRTEDLRRRFVRVETMLFRLRLNSDDLRERTAFVKSLSLDWWETVTEEEKTMYAQELKSMSRTRGANAMEDDDWFKVDWDRVPELVEQRKVFLKKGKAFVPGREQASMVVGEFVSRLERQLELTARALPRLDEDDRLTPILDHLSKNFITPDSSYSSNTGAPVGAEITARNIDNLAQHFPACMSHLHRSLRRDAHLKHYGRLQYTLFLKGIGLNLEECLVFWRQGFRNITDDTFNKEYRYNVRHVYGDNLTTLVQAMGVSDRATLNGVKEDKENQKFHMACNRYVSTLSQPYGWSAAPFTLHTPSVFEHLHKQELKKAKDEGVFTSAQLETIVHPNEYFKRSYLLKNLDKQADVKMEE
uniref:DNA primase large subunit n=1 Tax=Colletotrichum fructicola (strain Nara gc5) TaxID=1213859 RepID=L2FU55_COLFN